MSIKLRRLIFSNDRDEKWSKGFDPKLQKLLGELEAGLGTSLRHDTRKGTLYLLALITACIASSTTPHSLVLYKLIVYRGWQQSRIHCSA